MANENFQEYHGQSPGELVDVTDNVTPIDRAWAVNHVGLILHAILQALGSAPFGTRNTLAQRLLDIEAANIWEVSDTAPTDPVRGKVWFDTTTNELNAWDGNAWVEVDLGVGWITADAAPTNAEDGDGWYDTVEDELKIYNGSMWLQVGGGNDNMNTLPSGGSAGQALFRIGLTGVNWGDLPEKIDRNLQNILTNLTDTQKQTARTRQGAVGSTTITNLVRISGTDFDALSDADKDATTAYFVVR